MKKLLFILIITISLIGFASATDFTNGLQAYFGFSNYSNLVVNNIKWVDDVGTPGFTAVSCIYENCVHTNLGSSEGLKINQTNEYFNITFKQNRTINFWAKYIDTANDYLINFAGGYININAATLHISYANLGCNGVGTELPTAGMNMITIKRNDTGSFCYLNGVLDKNGTTYTTSIPITYITASAASAQEILDEMAIWNVSLTPAQIVELYNGGTGLFYKGGVMGGVEAALTVNLTSPSNNSLISSEVITFVSNYTSTNLKNFSNATYYVWKPDNSVLNRTTINVLNTANSSLQNITNFSLATSYKWNAYVCGYNASSYPVCNWGSAGNFTFTSSAFLENSFTFNNSVIETTRQSLRLNISSNPSVSSASAVLWYNGTSYSSSVTDGTSGSYVAINNLDIPLQSSAGNKTFFWEWTFALTTGSTVRQNSTIFTHQVNRTYLTSCNATYAIQFINFTSKSAINPFPKINATFKTAWNYWLGNGDVKRNYTFEDVAENASNWTFCGSNEDMTYKTNTNIEYDAGGYAQNYYYINNASLTNTTNQISLFLLNDSLATITVLSVVDNAQNPIANVTIQIQLYDIGTDTFYTVGMAKTAFNGEDIAYLNWYSTLYKFIFIQNGEVVKTTDPYKISSTPQTFTIAEAVTFSFEKFRDFVYSLTYNSVTQNFVLTFTKPSGLVDQGCLRVTKRTAQNDTEVCLICETSSSATLYCNIGSSGNGTFIATFYATGSWYILDWIEETIGSSFAETIYNLLGNDDATAYAFFFSGIVVAMFFLSPVLAIVGMILGVLGGAALGFTILNYTEFIGIVIVGGVIIWFVKR